MSIGSDMMETSIGRATNARLSLRALIESPAARTFYLTALGCAWVAGVLAAALWPGLQPADAAPLLLLGAACVAPLILGWPDARLRWAALLLAALLLGAARCAADLPHTIPEAGNLRLYNAPATTQKGVTPVEVRGVLAEEPVPSGTAMARFRIEASGILRDGAWLPVHGGLLVLAGRYSRVAPGDLIIAHGVLQDPPEVEGFDYPAYLLRQGIGSYMSRASLQTSIPGYASGPLTALAAWRKAAGEQIARQMAEPGAGLLRGIVLGEQYAIADDVRNDFATTGTAHLLAISGSNITLLLILAFFLARNALGLRGAIVASGVLAVVYSTFVVFGWPVWRAAIMVGLYLLANWIGRPVTGHTLLACTALLFTLFDPLAITLLSFQLSFVAMLGLITVGPLVKGQLAGKSWMLQALALSTGVQMFTDPLIALQYSRVSLISPVANLLIDWSLGPIMVLGLAQVLAGLIFAPLAQAIAWVSWVVLGAMILLVHVLALFPLAAAPLPDFGPLNLLGWYVLLALGLWWLYRRADRRKAAQAEAEAQEPGYTLDPISTSVPPPGAGRVITSRK